MADRFIDITLLGDKALQAKLDRIEQRVQKKIMRKALRDGGRPVLAAAKAKVRVDSGALKQGLKLRAVKRSRTTFGVYIRTPTRAELGIAEDDPGYYPAVIEYGAEDRRPLPYLRPAIDENRSKAQSRISGVLRQGIEAAAK